MAYNNYGYTQQYPQLFYPQVQQNTGIIWVQGENAAKAYPVSAGQSLLLMDSEDSVMYIKSTDQSGMPHLRVFEYKERTSNKEVPQTTEYVSKDEFNKFKEEIKDEIRRRRKTEEPVRESKSA